MQTMMERYNAILSREYESARVAITDGDDKRGVPVIGFGGQEYSAFHQGGGETIIAELMQRKIPEYSLVLIDEVESSLHPRAQPNLIRDLAVMTREREWQVVLTTHSPSVLEELPMDARAYIMQGIGDPRRIVYGISPNFAMTKMDDAWYADCDLYVEDERAERLLTEILSAKAPEIGQRCRTIAYGAASVGQALGLMVHGNRFPRPSRVFLDGDRGAAPGCNNLPGPDAPEILVFDALRALGWGDLSIRVGRQYAQVADACNMGMTQAEHHGWVDAAATRLLLPGDTLWQVMCSEWGTKCLSDEDARSIIQPIEDALLLLGPLPQRVVAVPAPVPSPATVPPSEPPTLFSRSLDDAPGSGS